MIYPPANESKRTPDQAAAHQFLTELRTRISTQPLPYQHGVEARALESMWEVFGQAREAIKENPGCEEFARRTTEVLNLVVRPLTAKWHRAFEDGRLNGRDGADEFRGELEGTQKKLRKFAAELHEMAYGKAQEDALAPPVMSDDGHSRRSSHCCRLDFARPRRTCRPPRRRSRATKPKPSSFAVRSSKS